MTVAIIDYGSGNLHSAAKAFARAASTLSPRPDITVTGDPEQVRRSTRLVLPGVGAFADCRAGLDRVAGMTEAIEEAVFREGKPFLGICVGMQLMAERGLEKSVTAGFGWIPGDVARIAPCDPKLKIPHMGWNTIDAGNHPLLKDIPTGPTGWHAYFVHSYHLAARRPEDVLARADYGGPITAMVARDNMAGTQFHPEKSQSLGLSLIANFLHWSP